MRYSPMSKASFDVPARVVFPVTPVFDCQVTFQLEVAVTGHFPVPPVRSLSRASAKSVVGLVGGISAGQQQCDRVFGVPGVMT